MRSELNWSFVWAAAFALAPAFSAAAWAAQDNPQPAPQKPAPEPPKKQEGVSKDDLLRQLTYAQLRERQRVWIEKQDATVEEIVDEFRKQSGVDILLDASNIPPGYRVRQFIVRNAPFREAFEHFLKMAELVIVEETPSIVRITRPIMMSLSVTDSDVKDVLSLISKVSGANLVMAPERIRGKITLNVNNVPWSEILQSCVRTLGYETVRERYDIIRIISPDELIQQMETKVFKLRYIAPPGTYKPKIDQNTKVEGQPFRGPASPDDIPRHFAFLKIIEATLSQDASGRPIGKSFFDPERNAVIVRDTKPVLDRIQAIVDILDTEPEMVMLSMKVLTTRNEDLLTWGTQWFGIDQLGAAVEGVGIVSRTTPFATGGGVYPDPTAPTGTGIPTQPGGYFPLGTTQTQQFLGRLPFGIGSGGPGVSPFYFLTEYDQRALFRAFKRDQYTKLLQEPTLSVLDNTEASIFVGESVPYAVARILVVPGAPTQVFAEEGNRSPVKIGFQILVSPRILKNENQVVVTVIPQNVVLNGSDQVLPGFERFNISGQEIVLPRTAETTILTRLKIDNNATAVMGGLVVERVTITDRGIPGLMDIPLLNFLFKQKSESSTKEHMLMFVTPKIVRNRRDLTEQLEAQRQLKAAQVEEELQRLRKSRAGQ
jgi:type IV pilus assembly protein PilQ